MTISDLDTSVLNSAIEFCIDEYVRSVESREILREHWFYNQTFEQLALKHHLSVTTIKRIIYKDGDLALLKATEIWNKSELK